MCPQIIDPVIEHNIDITVIPEGMTDKHKLLDDGLFLFLFFFFF